jgi:ribonuclease III
MDNKRNNDYRRHGSTSSYRSYDGKSERHMSHHRNDSDYKRTSSHRDNRYENDRNYHRRRSSRSPYRHSSYSSSRRSPSRSSYSSSRRRSRSSDVRGKSSDRRAKSKDKNSDKSERQQLLEKYRKNFCKTSEDIQKKLEEFEIVNSSWIRSSPADIYYSRTKDKVVESTARLDALCELFDEKLIQRSAKVREQQDPYNSSSLRKKKVRACRHKGDYISFEIPTL